MTRFVPVTVLMVVLAASGVASAQSDTNPTGPLANGASITFSELKIHENNNPVLDFPVTDPDSKWHYFNLAHCQCSQPGVDHGSDFHELTFAYLLQLAGANGMPVGRPLEMWVGPNCMDDAARTGTTATCHRIDSAGQTSVDLLTSPGNVRPEIPLFDFMTPMPGATTCLEAQQSSTLWALVDTNANNVPDYFVSQQITTDTQPPASLPTDFRAAGGEGSIVISWKAPADASDIYAYQALCARADAIGGRAKTSGLPPQRYMTSTTLCGLHPSLTLTPIDIPTPAGAPDAGAVVTPTGGLADLDPTFLCGEQTTSTATSMLIDGLQNGVSYEVVLLVVDKFQNASGMYFTSTISPVPSTDFWEDLHGRGSQAQGGLCLLAETYGDDSGLTQALRAFRDDTLGGSRPGRWLTEAYYSTLAKLGSYVHGSTVLRIVAAVELAPIVAFALLWHCLTLPGVLGLIAAAWWCARRRRFLVRMVGRWLRIRAVRFAAALAAFAAFALGTGHAYAGGGYQPYWENGDAVPENQASPEESGVVTWHVGLRLGPYVPDIDKQLAVTPGPYQQMFGGAGVLPMLDVDRILWSGFGQFGVGLSAGYMQRSARTFTIDSKPTDNPRMRGADTNKFRLLPMALTATYRFTWLDDQYGVPIVPYVRGGLSYYLWWVNVTNGSLAKVCKGDGVEPDCSQDKALGASLGVQGSIGVAIRAERVDPSAAVSMRQSGIEHAGIYAELSLAQVSGFGSDSKLSVGDRTWFAGVDFEF